jgi:putative ABC transport system permease protein
MGIRTDITSWAAFEDWRRDTRTFATMTGFVRGSANLAGDFEAERVNRASVSGEFFDVLGVQPVLGRTFRAEELVPGGPPVAIVGSAVWTQRFGGRADVIGSRVKVNGVDVEIVGVMPQGFDFPFDASVWMPLRLSDQTRQSRGNFFLYVAGRLSPGTTLEAAQADMDRIAAAQAADYPQINSGMGIYVQSIREHLIGDVKTPLLVLLGAVGLVLLIACANVANLLLSRAASRQREIAVRLALGSGRGRLIAQLLTESVVIGLVGGALGLAVAWGGVGLFRGIAPPDLPRLDEVGVDIRVLAFTFALSVVTGILFGLAPSLQAAGRDLTSTLRQEGRGSVGARDAWRMRGALIVSELALSLVLLVGAGLLVRSFVRLSRTDSGFDAHGVLTARVSLSGPAYNNPDGVLGFYDRLFERLRAIPGVETVAGGTDVLLPELANSGNVTIEGVAPEPDDQRIEVTLDAITPGYFRAIGTPLIAGRDIGPEDRADAPLTAVVNESMVKRYWPDVDPIGKRFAFGSVSGNDNPWITVVGVAADSRRTSQEKEARPSAFLSYRQLPRGSIMLLIRSRVDPLSLAPQVRAAVRELDPSQPLAELATLESILSERLAQRRLTTLLSGLFSGLALVLALVGVYGVLSYAVAQSTREIGVRIALGASVRDVMRMVFRRMTGLLAGGLALGLAGALAATRALGSLLYGVGAIDPATFVLAPVALGLVAMAACWIPARRATRVDPAVALRSEA